MGQHEGIALRPIICSMCPCNHNVPVYYGAGSGLKQDCCSAVLGHCELMDIASAGALLAHATRPAT